MEAAAQCQTDQQQSQPAHEQVEEADRKAVRLFRHGLVPRAGQGKNDRGQQHTEHAPGASAAVVADGADEHPGEAQHAAQRFGRCHPVGIAIEEMGEDDAQKALGAVEDAAKGTRQQGNGHIVERILGCGLPQAQGAALAQDFAAGRLREFALQDQASRQHQQAAQHEPDPGKAEDGGRIIGLDRKQAVAHLDERERRTPQHIAADGQQHREEGRPEDGVQFGRAGIFNVRHPLSGCGCRPGCRRRRMRWSSRRRRCPRRRSCPR